MPEENEKMTDSTNSPDNPTMEPEEEKSFRLGPKGAYLASEEKKALARKRRSARNPGPKVSAAKKKIKKLQERRHTLNKSIKKKEEELQEKEDIVEQMKLSPTPAKQRQLLFAKFQQFGFEPIDEMIKYAMNPNVALKERMSVTKDLAGLAYAKPKSIDVQGTMQSDIHVHVIDFKNTSQASLNAAEQAQKSLETAASKAIEAELLEDEDDPYAEFESPEDRRANQSKEPTEE